MVTSEPKTKILLITNDENLEKEISGHFAAETGYTYTGFIKTSGSLSEVLSRVKPNIILAGYETDLDSYLAMIDSIASSYTQCAIIAVLPADQVHIADRVILAGARAILLSPFTHATLISTIGRINELIQRGKTKPHETISKRELKNNCVVVYSPKGGVGCSTIAVNLAIDLHRQTKEKVLLVDGKSTLGHIALMLNIRTANTIADLIHMAGKLDPELIRQVVVEHNSGISVLSSPVNIAKGIEIHPEELFRVMLALKELYPYIVIDGGSHLDNNLVTYMDMADFVLLVVNANIASLKDSKHFLDLVRTLSYPAGKVKLILNNAGKKTAISIADIEKSLGSQIFGIIPLDQDISINCLNEGIPISIKKESHPISKAIKEITKKLMDALQAKATVADQRGDHVDILQKTSYLG